VAEKLLARAGGPPTSRPAGRLAKRRGQGADAEGRAVRAAQRQLDAVGGVGAGLPAHVRPVVEVGVRGLFARQLDECLLRLPQRRRHPLLRRAAPLAEVVQVGGPLAVEQRADVRLDARDGIEEGDLAKAGGRATRAPSRWASEARLRQLRRAIGGRVAPVRHDTGITGFGVQLFDFRPGDDGPPEHGAPVKERRLRIAGAQDPAPWERRPGEQDRAWAAFTTSRDLGRAFSA
jgi:hypothetical protein